MIKRDTTRCLPPAFAAALASAPAVHLLLPVLLTLNPKPMFSSVSAHHAAGNACFCDVATHSKCAA